MGRANMRDSRKRLSNECSRRDKGMCSCQRNIFSSLGEPVPGRIPSRENLLATVVLNANPAAAQSPLDLTAETIDFILSPNRDMVAAKHFWRCIEPRDGPRHQHGRPSRLRPSHFGIASASLRLVLCNRQTSNWKKRE
jgi:hypothetical protein